MIDSSEAKSSERAAEGRLRARLREAPLLGTSNFFWDPVQNHVQDSVKQSLASGRPKAAHSRNFAMPIYYQHRLKKEFNQRSMLIFGTL